MPLKAFVLEDNASIRDSLVEALYELAGIETAATASNERNAVAWLSDPAHAWDVAIIDLVLEPRGGSGFGVLRSLKARKPSQKMVVLTGTASVDVRRQCEKLGADGVFDKSMETDALIDWCIALARDTRGPGE
ncbi:MAG TPA: response regulator [Ramlibacter sp.]|uniref:response regulator n=1 Tax=Ramlibacter sp. TaxID=1917967 RepID=UPI002BAC4998|nr:response regulator [Ramlibacter sp.]HVZ45519.1 response regulator [Ramlibacter sp.]